MEKIFSLVKIEHESLYYLNDITTKIKIELINFFLKIYSA